MNEKIKNLCFGELNKDEKLINYHWVSGFASTIVGEWKKMWKSKKECSEEIDTYDIFKVCVFWGKSYFYW